MENVAASKANATIVDYRREVDGKTNPDYGKELTISYDIPAFSVVSTLEEVNKEFSEKQLIAMAQSRQKATENSSARQKAVSKYAASGDDLAKENLIKNFMTLRESAGKPVSREEAEQHVASLLA